MSEGLQHWAVGLVVFGALAFLVHRFTGWPRLRALPRAATKPAVLGDKLARGLEKAKKNGKH